MVFGRRGSDDGVKRSARRWRLIALSVIGIMLASVLSGNVGEWFENNTPHIARVEVSGIIEEDAERSNTFKEIAGNNNIKAVILYLNTPGGTVVGGETLYQDITRIRAQKPVVVVMGDIATSAGYMVALGADYIFAHNGTLTGSIGVLLQSMEITGLAQKIGVTMDTVKSAPLKGSPSPFEKMSYAARQSMQAVVNDFYSFFIGLVVKERKLPQEEVQKLADGRVFTGSQALQAKLIDAIGGEEEAVKWLENNKKIEKSLEVRPVALGEEPSKLQELREELGISTKNTPMQRFSLQGLVSIW